MAQIEKNKNLAIQRFGPPPPKSSPQYGPYTQKLVENGRAATDFVVELQKQVNKAFDMSQPSYEGMDMEHLGIMFLLHDLYVHDFIELLLKLEETKLARKVGSEIKLWIKEKITLTTSSIPEEFKKYLAGNETETIETSMVELMRIHRSKALKPENPTHFAFLSEVFAKECLADKRYNAVFVNTFFTALVIDQKDLQLVKSKLSTKTPFKSMPVMDSLATAVDLLKKFNDVFLVALVDADHPSHTAARNLFDTFTSDYNPGMSLTQPNLPTFATSSIGQALISRVGTPKGRQLLGSSPGDWLIRFTELVMIQTNTVMDVLGTLQKL